MIPCQNPDCVTPAGGVIVGRQASCSACGAIYRYNLDGTTPFLSLARNVSPRSNTWVDLFPASGDGRAYESVFARQAINDAEHGLAAPATKNEYQFGGSRIAPPVSRYGRLYTLVESGKVIALDVQTLRPLLSWSAPTLQHWTPSDLDATRMAVSGALLTIAHRDRLLGLDVGTGSQVFELRQPDLTNWHGVVDGDRLLVYGTNASGIEVIRLFTLDAGGLLAGREPMQVGQEWTGSLVGSLAPPRDRIAALAEAFYIITHRGELVEIEKSRGASRVIFPNYGGKLVSGWAVTPELGAVVLAPFRGSEQPYTLATFEPADTQSEPIVSNIRSLQSTLSTRVMVWGGRTYVVDEGGSIHCIERNGDVRATWPLASGLHGVEFRDAMLIPWKRNAAILTTVASQLMQRLRFVWITGGDDSYGADIGVYPARTESITVQYSSLDILVCYLTRGAIYRYAIDPKP